MFRELLSLLRSDDPLARLGTEFSEMLSLGQLLTVKAGGHFFEGTLTPDEDLDLHEEDHRIDELQRSIRKEVITRLTLGLPSNQLPYALLVMSLAEDAEQIGDHAKRLAAVRRDLSADLPGEGDPNVAELREIRRGVERAFAEVAEVFAGAESDRARELIDACRDTKHRAEGLIRSVAQAGYTPPGTTAMVVAAAEYGRIAMHLTRILSGVVLPLHELGLYDEDLLGQFMQKRDEEGASD